MAKALISFITGFISANIGEEMRQRFCRSASDTLNGATINPYLEELKISHELMERLKKQEVHLADLQQTVGKLHNYMIIVYAASSAIIAMVCLSSICCYLMGIRKERRCRLESQNEEMKKRMQEYERSIREAANARDSLQRMASQDRPLVLSIPGLSSSNHTGVPVTS